MLFQNNSNNKQTEDIAHRIHWWLVLVLQLILAVELGFSIYREQWFNVFLIIAIVILMQVPVFIGRTLRIDIPSEFQILAIIFVFAALFLGEIRAYYIKLWWWDILLHASSGLLLGIFGFLLVYVLNENPRADVNLKSGFVAFFAFLFAVATGAIWEIFEFAADQLLGANMQKPMLGDPSGLTDTMWDLIVDTLGALLISVLGWWYMNDPKASFIERWIQKFIDRNPHWFRNIN